MDQAADFDNLYALNLAPFMDKLRAECKSADTWGIVGIISFVLAMVTGFLGLQVHYLQHYGVLFALLFSLAIVSLFKYTRKREIFTKDYKSFIVKEIISHVCPGVIYKPDECVSEREYKASSLFRQYFDYFDGNDYIEGTVNNVNFHCSELWTQYDSGNRQPTIFKGLFFVVKIDGRFTGGTYAWARGWEQLPASIMDDEYRLMHLPDVYDIHFEDQAFSHYFRVCTTYETQAREILSPAIRQQMINLRNQSRAAISFSFVAGNCYFAIPSSIDLLEPSDYDPGDKEEIRGYYDTIQLIVGIINQLGLNNLA